MSDQPIFFGEDPQTPEEVDKVTDQWAEQMTYALGVLIEEGYFVLDEKDRHPLLVLSDIWRFTPKGQATWKQLTELVLPAIVNGGSGMPEYYAAAQYLIDNGHTDLSLHAIYGLLTWGTQITYENEDRQTMGDGFRRKWHAHRPDGFKLDDHE